MYDRNNNLTNTTKDGYNKGDIPIRCRCGKIVAYENDGVIYIFCKSCKRQIAIINRAKSQ